MYVIMFINFTIIRFLSLLQPVVWKIWRVCQLWSCQPRFLHLVYNLAFILMAYRYSSQISDLYKTKEDKNSFRTKMFDSMDLKNTGVITFDEWYRFSMENIAAKTANIAPHPILVHGS